MNYREIVETRLNELAKSWGTETFVSDGYGYFDDAASVFAIELENAFAAGVEAERKRAAGIAEKHGADTEGFNTSWDMTFRSACRDIAEAIRKGE